MFSSSFVTTPPDEEDKPFEPTPTKKAWRRRLQLDSDAAPQLRSPPDHNSLTPPTQSSDVLMQLNANVGLSGTRGLTSPGETVLDTSNITGQPLQPLATTRLFACGQCGKCFVSLKYLDMHAAALHAGKSATGCDFIIVEPTAMPSVVSAALSTSSVNRILLPVALPGSTTVSSTLVPTGVAAPTASAVATATPAVSSLRTVATTHRPHVPLVFRVPVTSPTPIQSVRYPVFTSTATDTSAAAAVRPVRGNEWKCETCKKSFSQNSSYRNHQRTHSDERPFVCTVCSIGFKERYHLKKHILFKHTDELREECNVCGKRFKDTTAVRAHERIHSEQRPYSCQRCDKAFKTSECLWHHENRSKSCGNSSTAGGRKATAGFRGSSEATRRLLKQPRVFCSSSEGLATLNGGGNDRVMMLPTSVSGLSNQLPHEIVMLFEHELNTAAVVDVVDDSSATNRSAYVRHLKEETVENDINFVEPRSSCHRDGLVLLANCAVQEPVPEMTSMKKETSTTLLQVKVEPQIVLTDYELTAMTSSESSFYERIREMTSGSELPESDDSKTSSSSSSGDGYQLAKKVGDVESLKASAKQLECNRCARKFSSTRALEKHAVIHSEARPYLCDKCDVGFKLKVHLKKHILYRHSNDYHCTCRHCGKKFKDSSAVRLHERIHSADRPFGCSSCGKTFKTRENLWGHRHRGPCGSASPTVSGGQTLEACEPVVVSTTPQTSTSVDTSRWSSAASGQTAVVTSSPSSADDWIAKLLTASAAAVVLRPVSDVTLSDAAATRVQCGVGTATVSTSPLTSPLDTAAVMTPAEQQALLSKAILLSKMLQSQYACVTGGGRHVMSQSLPLGVAVVTTAGTTLPTAVVNPIKRSKPEHEHDGHMYHPVTTGSAASPNVIASGSSAAPSSAAVPPLQQLSPMSRQLYAGTSVGKAHYLPPIETFRAYHSSPAGGGGGGGGSVPLSQNEADQMEDATSSSSFPATAVNLSLHSTSPDHSAADSIPAENVRQEQAGDRRLSDPAVQLRVDSQIFIDHHQSVSGASNTLRRVAHEHGDVVRRSAVVMVTGGGGGTENQMTQLQHGQGL